MSVQRVSAESFDWSADEGPAADVRRIATASDRADGVVNLNEHAVLQLKHRGLRDAALWLGEGGFALVHDNDKLDLVVAPESRGRGTGTELARLALAATPRVEAWSHGDHPAAARIAARFGIPRERSLVIMSRPTTLPVEDPVVPPGVLVRSFHAGDENALLEVNAAAFAHHPEQGHMTLQDFHERVAEDWFEPAGLLLAVAESDGSLLGFHWTKVHREADPPYGEVYVVAVNPKAAGRGLGTLLTQVGLRHLASTGVGEVILYVDGDNDPALAVYSGQGFTAVRTEVQYVGETARQ
jgi:mycothiol synthase